MLVRDAVPAILPGLMCDSRMFAAVLERLPGAVVIDGFYAGCDRIEAMAEYALARLPERIALIGHSMGARVALEIVRRAPERVERLALVDTGIHTVRAGEREKRYALYEKGCREGMIALVDEWLPPMVGEGALRDPALIARLHAMAVSSGLAVFRAQVEALLHRPDLSGLLPTIRCPTYAIVGREDLWSPVSQHEEIAAAIPGAQLRIVEGAGHMMPAEQPEAFSAVLAQWLAAPAQ
ncbi:alpha/beta hydrolase [Sphingobium amiense]|uniref:Alpha/beta hydrolase n=1 Tax=Sphingobium amiense TaxID=135719 RepID=A0A494VXE8_9SPHN|nr:alpha/beta fold hydrolase [Sphingobium amiense]BBD97063.1 alpha/beta hydrolase [Sphingobium amiense]